MALLARDVIEAARDRHPAFDRHRNPDALLLRHLSREQRRLTGKIAQVNPQEIASVEAVSLDSYDFGAGHALPAHQALLPRGEVHFTDATRRMAPLSLRAMEDRPIAGAGYFAAVQAGRLFLFGTTEDWRFVASVRLSYVPRAVELTTLADVLTVPEDAEATLVAGLAAFLAGRGHVDPALPPIDVALLRAEAGEAEADLLREVRSRTRATTFRVREVC